MDKVKKGSMKKVSSFIGLCLLSIVLAFTTFSSTPGAEGKKTKELHIEQLFDGRDGTMVLKNLKMIRCMSITVREVKNDSHPNRLLKCRIR